MISHQVLYDNDGLFIAVEFVDNCLDLKYDDFKCPFADNYEHHLRLSADATEKLCEILKCDMDHLLEKVKENFGGIGRTGHFRDFCDQHKLKYETFTWIS